MLCYYMLSRWICMSIDWLKMLFQQGKLAFDLEFWTYKGSFKCIVFSQLMLDGFMFLLCGTTLIIHLIWTRKLFYCSAKWETWTIINAWIKITLTQEFLTQFSMHHLFIAVCGQRQSYKPVKCTIQPLVLYVDTRLLYLTQIMRAYVNELLLINTLIN